MFNKPVIADFKTFFDRDFQYGTDNSVVKDSDLTRAFRDADRQFADSLFPDQDSFTDGYLYLAAHMLVMNIRASSDGIGGSFDWAASSKSVGSVSESFAIPQRILENPNFAVLAQTNYGNRYLMMILPALSGAVFVVQGGTNA